MFLALPLLVLAGCGDRGPDWPLALEAGDTVLSLASDGRVAVEGPDGPIVAGGFAQAVLAAAEGDGIEVATRGDHPRTASVGAWTDALGEGETIELFVDGEGTDPDLTWRITAYEAGFYTFRLDVHNGSEAPVDVAKISALRVEGPSGGLWLGADPAAHRILENGAFTVLDFVAEVRPGDAEANSFATIAPGQFEGHSVSNWDHAVVDLDGDAAWVAGALTFAATMPVLELSYAPTQSTADGGRDGFSFFSATGAYLPQPKRVEPGGTLVSERFYVHPAEDDALLGLERYAEAVAASLDAVPWHRREPGRRVPNGWNSWSGSSSSGGYGKAIDETIILANLEVMAIQLRDWGFDWYQVDDGYQPLYGDWTWNPDRFPHGPEWLTAEIRSRDLVPGLWMAPFTLDPDSQTVADHPEWMADKTLLGQVVVGDQEILDLTHPEALAWIRERARVLHEDWGFDWLKLDFGYLALFGENLHDPTLTREEAWGLAMGAVREGLGEDAFFLGVGPIGLGWAYVDANRTTLDNMPVWDWQPGVDIEERLDQQGLKPTVRTAGRRWFAQDRIWVNHPDLIFFRSNPNDLSWPRLTFEESRAFCTFVGLSGGIVKLGDRLVDLQPEHIDTIRRLVPIHGGAARPLDVFEREFPEVWRLDLDQPLDGLDEQWTLFGLFHWGANLDLTTNPYSDIRDDPGARTHVIDLAEQGLSGPLLAYEFWTGTFLGVVEDALEVSVPSHDSRVVALRPVTGAPQFLGWNRQITMGGVLVEAVAWDEAERTLTLTTPVTPGTGFAPFTYELAFYVPPGFEWTSARVDGVATADLETVRDGAAVRVRFAAGEEGTADVVLSFAVRR